MQRWPHLATSGSSSSLTGGDGGAAASAASAAAAAIRPASAAAFAHLQPSVSKSFNYGVPVDVASPAVIGGGIGVIGGGGGANVSNGSFVPSVDAFNVSSSGSRLSHDFARSLARFPQSHLFFFFAGMALGGRVEIEGEGEGEGQYKLDLGAAEFIRPSVRPSIAAAAANIPFNAFRVRGVGLPMKGRPPPIQ